MSSRKSIRQSRSEARAARRRNQRVLIGVIVLIILGLAAYFAYSAFFAPKANTTAGIPTVDPNIKTVTTASGLKYQDIAVGSGKEAQPQNQVTVNYTGWLENGTKFDSSFDHGQPFTFTLGAGNVIPGWDEGVQGMKEGGKRRLIIPPDLGYGSTGSPPTIPPNSTLIFDVDLLKVQ
jgi:peptidylprolyl isomerase